MEANTQRATISCFIFLIFNDNKLERLLANIFFTTKINKLRSSEMIYRCKVKLQKRLIKDD
jgi:hypothetical protein